MPHCQERIITIKKATTSRVLPKESLPHQNHIQEVLQKLEMETRRTRIEKLTTDEDCWGMASEAPSPFPALARTVPTAYVLGLKKNKP